MLYSQSLSAVPVPHYGQEEPSTGPDIAALPQQHLVKMEADLKGEMDVAGELPAKKNLLQMARHLL